MKSFSELKKNLKQNRDSLPGVKIALLGDSATQLLNQALCGAAIDYRLNAQIFESDFNQIELQILTEDSDLYNFQPDFVVIFYSSHKLKNSFYKKPLSQRVDWANQMADHMANLCSVINSKLKCQIIVYNLPVSFDSVFGNFAYKTPSSLAFQLQKLNNRLSELAYSVKNLFVCDMAGIASQLGRENTFHPSVYINSEMVLSIEALPWVACRTLDIISALKGRFKKCLILDLDNTTWGGIIGDDGIENIQIGSLGIGKAFSELQTWAKELKNRGIVLAICSKNTESVAKEPFEKHPDMVLKLEDIAVFVANWDNKADNIRYIQQVLNIGFDSMVFLDDNPFERNIVRENIPDICVPELPEDPAHYLEYIQSLNLFETVSFSEEDTERTLLYQTEAKRTQLQQSFVNEDDFLQNLQMVSLVQPFNKFNTPRVAQLSQRSNQFNLRTVRYSESDIEDIATSQVRSGLSFTLEDKFGDNGLICVIVLQKNENHILFIETWLMSCRVLKRGMENFVLNQIVEFAKQNNCTKIVGEYLPTAKNSMVKDHYKNLGFTEENGQWVLPTEQFIPLKTFIQAK